MNRRLFMRFDAPPVAADRALAALKDKPEWKHPYFWAAWQLWGLPE